MKISIENIEENIIFKISKYDEKYKPVFDMCYYQFDGVSYYKKYPINTKNIAKIANYFRENAEIMFNQLGYFIDIPWEKGLLEFCKIIKNREIKWWLTGSCAACIRGVNLNPHDVDIIIDSNDCTAVENLFSDFFIEPLLDTNGWLTKDFGVLFLHSRIDIASDPSPKLDDPEPSDCGPYAQKHLETVNWNGFDIKVPPLKLQINVNRRRGRLDRVDLINRFILETNR